MKSPITNYTKEKIMTLKFNENNVNYINSLMLMESEVLKKKTSQILCHYKNILKEEYEGILKELNFEEYKKLIKYEEHNKEINRLINEKIRRKEKEIFQETKRMWDRVRLENNSISIKNKN